MVFPFSARGTFDVTMDVRGTGDKPSSLEMATHVAGLEQTVTGWLKTNGALDIRQTADGVTFRGRQLRWNFLAENLLLGITFGRIEITPVEQGVRVFWHMRWTYYAIASLLFFAIFFFWIPLSGAPEGQLTYKLVMGVMFGNAAFWVFLSIVNYALFLKIGFPQRLKSFFRWRLGGTIRKEGAR